MKKIIVVLVIVNILLFFYVLYDGRQEQQLNMVRSDAFVQMRMAYDEQRFDDAYEQGVKLLQQQQAEDVYYLLALSAFRIEKFEESTDYFEKVIARNPNRLAQPIFLLQFAESLMANEENVEAQKILRRALQIAPDERYKAYVETHMNALQGRSSS